MSNRNARRSTPATTTPSATPRAKRAIGSHKGRRIVVVPEPTPADPIALPAPSVATDADRTDPIEATTDTAQEAAPAVEALAPAQTLPLAANVLSALLSCAGLKDDNRPYLRGVHVQQTGGELRLAATDGHRLLIVTQAAPDPIEWASQKGGVILPGAELARVLKFAGKDAVLALTFGVDHPAMTAAADFGTFNLQPIGGDFPQLEPLLKTAAETLTSGHEAMQAHAMNAAYIKGAGAVAATLGSDAVYCFTPATDGAATVYTFHKVPGALLLIMGLRDSGFEIQPATVRLIGEAGMTSSIAALKAHETRNRKAAKNAKTAKETEALTKAADAFRARIEAIMSGLKPALPAPEATKSAADDEAEAA